MNGGAPETDRAVVFDLDETLHRLRRFTVGGYAHVSRWLASRTGADGHQVFRRLWGLYRRGRGATAYQTVCRDLGLPAEFAATLLRHHRAHPARLRLTRSADFALAALRGSWRLAVLTNGLPELQRIKVAALGLEPRVDVIVYADELVPGGKPAPAVFEAVSRQLGVRPGRCVMVGDDGVADMQGGRRAGMHTIWMSRPARPTPPHGTVDAVLESCADLPRVAGQLIGPAR